MPDHGQDKCGSYLDYLKKMRDRLKIAYYVARETLNQRAQQTKKYYDKNMRLITYKPGTQVIIKDHAPKEERDGKMCAKFIGPFLVIDKLGDVNYRIQQTQEGRPQVVNYNRMKPYTSRQPVIEPNWVKRISKL